MSSYNIDVKNCEQQNYIFSPAASKKYNIQTVGNLDTVLVVTEKSGDKQKYVAGDDNSGTDNNALVSVSLQKGKTYLIKVKVYYKKKNEKAALMIS